MRVKSMNNKQLKVSLKASGWKIIPTDDQRLQKIAEVIEAVDARCMAVDGPVTETKDEITSKELMQIYKLAKKR